LKSQYYLRISKFYTAIVKKLAFYIFFFFPCLVIGEQELQVYLHTRTPLKSVYLAQFHHTQDSLDWRYIEELREALAFDLENNGYTRLVTTIRELEDRVVYPNPEVHFSAEIWKKDRISFLFVPVATKKSFGITLFLIDTGAIKKYPALSLSGELARDRAAIHCLADKIQKDLFGRCGIAGHRIIFSQRNAESGNSTTEWLSDIRVCDWDGSNPSILTKDMGYCISPFLLPDSLSKTEKKYYFASSKTGQNKIYLSSFPSGEAKLWIKLRGNQLLPNVNAQGSQIAFISDIAGRPDLFIQNLDAKGNPKSKPQQLFSAPRATQASPTYSPSGKQVAFVSDKDGTPRIYIVDIPDPQKTQQNIPRLISRKNKENTAPSWSPDGTKIAYSARTDGIRQIWIYEVNNEEEWQLTFGPEHKENPAWAPNSLHLVYNTETKDISELYLINLHQRHPVQISCGSGQKRFASWVAP
jgi:TolB protein